jgi:hypothetical protein
MKDLIIGCISNYHPEHIKPWVNSIIKSGFEGDKIIISFGVPEETITYLTQNGFEIYSFEPNGRHIVIERFYALWGLMNELQDTYRYIITTDVKDVIFQYNPSQWLENNLHNKKILVSSECLTYSNEDWGNNNLKTSYPQFYENNKNNVIYNAGTIAGDFNYMKDFFLHIFNLSLIGNDSQPDQAALNILIHTYPFKDHVLLANQENGWCCQLGTTLDPKVQNKYLPLLLEPIPSYDDKGLVYNSKNELFCLVHQYDRVPELKKLITPTYS